MNPPHKLNAPVKLAPRQYRGESKGVSCIGVFFAVFCAFAALIILLWGVAFLAHIGHEENVIKAIDQREKEMNGIPASDLDQTELESNLREIPKLMQLREAAMRSRYDPIWFLDGAP